MLLRSLLTAVLFCIPALAQTAEVEAVVTTSLGTFRFEFAPDKAPKHVEQFIRLARSGYYDGSAFFRVVGNGMIQGGDPLLKNPKTAKALWGTGGLSLLASEFSDMKHERGVVSTVSIPGKPNSDGAQFFVCVVAQPSLDGKYSSFGTVNEGMDVVEAISRAPATAGITDTPVRILKVTIEPKKQAPFVSASMEQLHRSVTMKTTLGTVRVEMEPEWAPEHVRNFLMLVETGWYNGTAFHRIVKGFVAQGGLAETRQPPGHAADRWVHELKGEFRGDLKHERGIVSMARADDPNSATTSFFLMLGAAPHLDGKYSAFGKITEGLDVLDAFEKEDLDSEAPRRRLEVLSAVVDPVRQ